MAPPCAWSAPPGRGSSGSRLHLQAEVLPSGHPRHCQGPGGGAGGVQEAERRRAREGGAPLDLFCQASPCESQVPVPFLHETAGGQADTEGGTWNAAHGGQPSEQTCGGFLRLASVNRSWP